MSDIDFITCGLSVIAALKLFVLQQQSSGKYRFWCQCCKKNVHISTSGQYNTLHDIMVAIPYVSITHWLARRLRQYSSEMESMAAEDY